MQWMNRNITGSRLVNLFDLRLHHPICSLYTYVCIYSLEQIWSCLDTAARRRVCAQLAKEHLSLILIVQYATSSLARENRSESESGYTCNVVVALALCVFAYLSLYRHARLTCSSSCMVPTRGRPSMTRAIIVSSAISTAVSVACVTTFACLSTSASACTEQLQTHLRCLATYVCCYYYYVIVALCVGVVLLLLCSNCGHGYSLMRGSGCLAFHLVCWCRGRFSPHRPLLVVVVVAAALITNFHSRTEMY